MIIIPLLASLALTACPASADADADCDQPKEEQKEDVQKEDESSDEEKEDDEKKDEEPEKPFHSVTGQVAFMSDYRFRGLSQTMRRPAVQGNLDYSNLWGFYLGTFGSNVDGTTHYYNNTSMEWDFYGGQRGDVCGTDFKYDVGGIFYFYPGGQSLTVHPVGFNTFELYLQLGYRWFTVKASETLTNYFGFCSNNTPFNWQTLTPLAPNGSSKGSTYIEGNFTYDIYDKPNCWKGGKLTLQLHAGHQWIRHYSPLDYTDWRVTLTQEMDWFNLFITYVGTDASSAFYDIPDNTLNPSIRSIGAQGVVIGIFRSF